MQLKGIKRTLFITHDFPPIVSGISTVFYHLLKGVKGKEIILVAPRVEGYEEVDRAFPHPVKRVWLPLGSSMAGKAGKTLLSTLYLLYISSRWQPNSIHCGQILSNGLGGWLVKKLLSIPYTLWVYGSETVRLGQGYTGKTFLRKILKEADRVIVNSEFTKEEYLRFGTDGSKLTKITPGVDTSTFRPMDRNKELEASLGLEGKKVILTVARLDERKGHDMVIRALPQVIKEVPDALYLVVGKGREEERLRGMVGEQGLEGKVIFAGYVPDRELPLYYNLCDVFCLPNRVTVSSYLKGDYEGFGIVFLEASSCGKPVIAGKSGGVGDAVLDGVTGILVDPYSVDEIASALVKLLKDKGLAERMGRAGRERAVSDFDWTILSKRLEAIL